MNRFFALFESPAARYVLFAAAFTINFHFVYFPLDISRSFAAILPPAGLVLGTLLLTRPETWWLWAGTGGAIAFAYSTLLLGVKPLSALSVVLVGAAQLVGSAWLMRRWCGPRITFERVRELMALLLAATVVNLAATLLAGALLYLLQGEELGRYVPMRWASFCLSILIVTPLLVVLGQSRWHRLTRHPMRLAEAALLFAASLAIVSYALGGVGEAKPVPFLVLVPLIVAAVRFGLAGACMVSVVTAAKVIYAVGQGGAWPTGMDPVSRLAEAEIFLGIVTVTGFLLGASLTQMRAVERSLRESEGRFRAIFETTPHTACLVRKQEVVAANPELLGLFATDLERLRLQPVQELVGASQREVFARYLASAEAGPVGAIEVPARRWDGTEFPAELRASRFVSGDESYLVLICLDLTERQRITGELKRMNRALRATSRCGHVIVHAKDEASLLTGVCRVLAEAADFPLVWVGLAEHDARKSVRVAAAAGEAAADAHELRVTWGEEESARGPVGTAIRTGAAALAHDVTADPRFEAWRTRPVWGRGGSLMALPLRVGGDVVGALAIYSRRRGAFDEQESALLGELAEDVSFGIESIRVRLEHERAEAEVRRLLSEAEQVRRTLLGVLEDRRKAEEALERSEERYRTAMHHSAVGMALVGLDGRWLEVNPALSRIVGYSREELLQLRFQDITSPDDSGEDTQLLREAVAGRITSFQVEKRYRHKDGRAVWVHIHSALLRGPTGEPLHFISQTQDVTTRKATEASLAETTERLSVALTASRFGIWRYTFETRTAEWDARMFALFGRAVAAHAPSVSEILAQVVESDRKMVERSWRLTPACPRTYHVRFRITRLDGVVRHIELQGTVHEDESGRPTTVTGVAGDITEIVENAAEAERLKAQLQQAQKMEALGNLAAGVAHDFNNLLTGINGFVELASTTLAPSHEATQLLKQAQQGAMSARDLVRRILSFSRGSNATKRAVIDLAEVVRDTAPLLAAALPANVSLSVFAGAAAFPVLADSGQLQQVLLNLCTNGAHAIGGKPGTLRIAVERCEVAPGDPVFGASAAGGTFVRVSVADDGCGMDDATRQRIFEPFFTTKKDGQGTGLGLPNVRDIVTSHEGALEVKSELGRGSVFSVYLPLSRTEGSGRVMVEAARPLPVGAGQRVLVVDDEAAIGMVARIALQKHGYDVEVHADAPAALQVFLADPAKFDLIVADQNMPGLAGSTMIERARAVRKNLPAILMSGRFEEPRAVEALRGGGVAGLKKPFEIAELLKAVGAALGVRGDP
jgi:PAS domain S-box-containing protein